MKIFSKSRPAPAGRIITFYSYKGGTGRSMAVANVAWILASHGRRVLVLDWDLEAPGLHRYFRPFLADPELSQTPGLIDCFVDFTEAAHDPARLRDQKPPAASPAKAAAKAAPARPWFYEAADISTYSIPVAFEFPDEGLIDFVGAGKQGASYGPRVNSFQWGDFYQKLGGGTFIEAMKMQLRKQYDYVLVDSRTGLSDTSGICTVQMPDELVVCFTLNRQSILGATATADSADAQRRLKNGAPGLRIWPVPTRVELAEKERLEAAQLLAREKFAPFLWHIGSTEREEYWGGIEVPYFPYYAYEEILATIADLPKRSSSLLASMERLTARLTNSAITALPDLGRRLRSELRARYEQTRSHRAARPGQFFLSYASADHDSLRMVPKIATALDREFGDNAAFWSNRIPLGVKDWSAQLREGLARAEIFILLIGPKWPQSRGSKQELKTALRLKKRVVPVLVGATTVRALPPELRSRRCVRLNGKSLDQELQDFVEELAELGPDGNGGPSLDINDPHLGVFGGQSERNGRAIQAKVTRKTDEWFNIVLTVRSTRASPLKKDVVFHLHPSFRPAVVKVTPLARVRQFDPRTKKVSEAGRPRER